MEIRSGKRTESNSAVTVRRTTHPDIVRHTQPHLSLYTSRRCTSLTKADIEIAQALFLFSLRTRKFMNRMPTRCLHAPFLLYDLLSTYLLHITFKGLFHIDIDIIFAFLFCIVASSETLRLSPGSTVHVPLYHTLTASGGLEKYEILDHTL